MAGGVLKQVTDLAGSPAYFPQCCAWFWRSGAGFTLLRCGGFHVEGTLPVGVNDAIRTRLTRGGVLQLAWNVKVGTRSEFFWLLTFEPLQHGSGNHDAS